MALACPTCPLFTLFCCSNAFMARLYAKTILGFLHDEAVAGRIDRSQPVYIVEVGSGSGKFGFLLVKALLEKFRLSTLPLSCFKCVNEWT